MDGRGRGAAAAVVPEAPLRQPAVCQSGGLISDTPVSGCVNSSLCAVGWSISPFLNRFQTARTFALTVALATSSGFERPRSASQAIDCIWRG
jgi:hypothetical protein